MDLQRLRKTALSSSSSLAELPQYIITSFLPGARPFIDRYPLIFRFFGLILALYYFGPIARLKSLWSQFSSMIVATVSVSSDEDLFSYLTSWIAGHRTFRTDQVLYAISNATQDKLARRRMRQLGIPDFEDGRRYNEHPKIKYEQGQGVQLFVHKGRLFFCSRKFGEGHTYIQNRSKRMEVLSISCLGRSPQPVKDLIEHIYNLNKNKERSSTIIRRPFHGSQSWSRVTSKPRRALDTVILSPEQKEQVLDDVAEYLNEATMNFYASHGIPYRRGYLFHGPPGVGKTSFALALASKFDLDVYNLSLLDVGLTDSDLISLLNQLPSRSLLLLEDIDTAGLKRKGKATVTPRGGGGAWGRRRGPAPRDPDEIPLENDDEGGGTLSMVTLSGVLNAIDGVAAPEGHVLIMTTNKPNELDDALVRAGRISVRVAFTNATQPQAEEIFLRMFIEQPTTSAERATEESNSSSQPPSSVTETEKPQATLSLPDNEHSAQLRTLAKSFADQIPEGDFSPADLQDYLLIHKKNPEKAVSEVKDWMEKTFEERKKRVRDQEDQKEERREEKKKAREQFKEEIKAAVKGLAEEVVGEEGKKGDEMVGKEEDEKKKKERQKLKEEVRAVMKGLSEEAEEKKEKDKGDEKAEGVDLEAKDP